MFCNGLRCDNPVCAYSQGRDYNTVDGRRFRNTSAAWTGPSKQQAYLKSKFVSNDYTDPNTNLKTLTVYTLTWTLTDRHDGRRLGPIKKFCTRFKVSTPQTTR